MTQKYDVDYFLNKFAAIDEEYWCEYEFRKGEQRCVLGWCGMNTERDWRPTPEARALIDILGQWPANINNGDNLRYQQAHPRARIINALCDVKESK